MIIVFYLVTHTQPFNGLVRDNPGRLVPEETLTHTHPSWSSNILYHLPPFTTINGILFVYSSSFRSTCPYQRSLAHHCGLTVSGECGVQDWSLCVYGRGQSEVENTISSPCLKTTVHIVWPTASCVFSVLTRIRQSDLYIGWHNDVILFHIYASRFFPPSCR